MKKRKVFQNCVVSKEIEITDLTEESKDLVNKRISELNVAKQHYQEMLEEINELWKAEEKKIYDKYKKLFDEKDALFVRL